MRASFDKRNIRKRCSPSVSLLCPGLGVFFPIDIDLGIPSLKVAARLSDKQIAEYIFYYPETCVPVYQNFIRIDELRTHAELLRVSERLLPGESVILADGKSAHIHEHGGCVDCTSRFPDGVTHTVTFAKSTLLVHGAIFNCLKEFLEEEVV